MTERMCSASMCAWFWDEQNTKNNNRCARIADVKTASNENEFSTEACQVEYFEEEKQQSTSHHVRLRLKDGGPRP